MLRCRYKKKIIYLRIEKPHLIFILTNFSLLKFTGSLRELQISFHCYFCSKNASNDIIGGNFDSEKVDLDIVNRINRLELAFFRLGLNMEKHLTE